MNLTRSLLAALFILLIGVQACGVKAPPIPRNSLTPQEADDQEEAEEQKKKNSTSS